MQKSSIYIIASFAVGVLAGAAATWQYFKNKKEQEVQEEVNSIREVLLKNHKKDVEEKEETIKNLEESIDSNIAKGIINYCGYAKKDTNNEIPKHKIGLNQEMINMVEEDKKVNGPYVITPQEFGEIDDYEMVTLIYYNDGYVTEDDRIVTDVEDVIGYEALNSFGEYEEDTVFVRNDERETDYEVLKDLRNYIDVVKEQREQSMELMDE